MHTAVPQTRPAAAAITRRLRPLAQAAVDAILAQSMSRRVPEALGDHFAQVLDRLQQDKAGTPAWEATEKAHSDQGGRSLTCAFVEQKGEI